MAAQVARHHHPHPHLHQSRHTPLHPLNKAAGIWPTQYGRSNGDARASSQTSLSSGSHSQGLGLQAAGRAFASNKAMAGQTMTARSIGSSLGSQSLGRAPSVDLASTGDPAINGHQQRQPGAMRTAPAYGNPVIVEYRRKVAKSFGFTSVNGTRRPLTTPQEILEQYAMFEEERQHLPIPNMAKLHTRDILIARRQYLLAQLARTASLAGAGRNAGRAARPSGRTAKTDARSSSSSSASTRSLSDPVHDSSWSDYCKNIEAVFLKAVKNHGKAHKGCTYDGEFPCEEWLEIMDNCRGQPSHSVYEKHAQDHPHCSLGGSHSCAAWLQFAQEVRTTLQREVETLFVAEQDIQRARACIFAICKNAMMLPFIRDYNRKLKVKKYLCKDGTKRSITLDREEMNGWREEIENTIALAYKYGKSVDAALRELRGRTVWKQLGEPERQYLKRYFKLDPKQCQLYEEPSDYLAPSGSTHASAFGNPSSSSSKSYPWTEMEIPEDQRSAIREELAAVQKERKKKFKMKKWIKEANASVPKVQKAMELSNNKAMPAAIAQTLQHMQAWEKHRRDVVPPMPSRDDAPSSVLTSSSGSSSKQSSSTSGSGSRMSGSSRSSEAKKSDRGRYDALTSAVMDESHSRPGGRSLSRAPPVYEEDEEGEGEYEDEQFDGYDEYDDDDTEALIEELRRSGRPHSSNEDGGNRQPTMYPGYDDGYGSMSSADRCHFWRYHQRLPEYRPACPYWQKPPQALSSGAVIRLSWLYLRLA